MFSPGSSPHPPHPLQQFTPGRFLAALLIAMLAIPAAPGPRAASPPQASLAGRVMTTDGKEPAQGAILRAVHIISQRVYTAPATDASGHFDLLDIPAGYYDIGIDYGGQLFVAATVVNLSGGGKLTLDFSLQPYGNTTTEWWQGQKREIPILGQEQGLAKVLERSRAAGGGKSFWKKPGGIVLISIAGAGAVAAAAGGGGGGSSGGGGNHASPSKP